MNPRTAEFPAVHGAIVEMSLLISESHAAALEKAASERGLTVGQLVRRLIESFTAAERV